MGLEPFASCRFIFGEQLDCFVQVFYWNPLLISTGWFMLFTEYQWLTFTKRISTESKNMDVPNLSWYALLTFPNLLLLISALLHLWTRNYRQILISLKKAEEMEKIATLHILTAQLDFLMSSQKLEI
jgi:hypothetical protein